MASGRIDQHRFFIGGDFVPPHGDERIEVINPATEEVTGSVPRAVAADMDDAVAAARTAFDETDWPHRPPAERADLLRAVAKRLEERNDEIARIITDENGNLFKLAVQAVGHRLTQAQAAALGYR
jgi:betaine-aldehyde dehydrogenase